VEYKHKKYLREHKTLQGEAQPRVILSKKGALYILLAKVEREQLSSSLDLTLFCNISQQLKIILISKM
jgi:hypothetical protein